MDFYDLMRKISKIAENDQSVLTNSNMCENNDGELLNNPDYTYYVVFNNKIVSGWEYREDAIDAAKDMLESGTRTKVVAKVTLAKYGINPDDNKYWAGMDDLKSPIEEKYVEDEEGHGYFTGEIDNETEFDTTSYQAPNCARGECAISVGDVVDAEIDSETMRGSVVEIAGNMAVVRTEDNMEYTVPLNSVQKVEMSFEGKKKENISGEFNLEEELKDIYEAWGVGFEDPEEMDESFEEDDEEVIEENNLESPEYDVDPYAGSEWTGAVDLSQTTNKDDYIVAIDAAQKNGTSLAAGRFDIEKLKQLPDDTVKIIYDKVTKG